MFAYIQKYKYFLGKNKKQSFVKVRIFCWSRSVIHHDDLELIHVEAIKIASRKTVVTDDV